MAMGDALGSEFLKVGAVILSHRFDFSDYTAAKYCVLLEDYSLIRSTTLVALTTSQTKFIHNPWFVEIPDDTCGIEGVTYLDCNNVWERPTTELASHNRYKYIGQIPDELLDDIYLALEYAANVPEEFLIRIFGEAIG